MAGARLHVLGVYRLEPSDELLAEQLRMFGNEAECRDHFSSVVLIEALVHNAEHGFSVDAFTQDNPNYPYGAPQVAYTEGLLSGDGQKLLARSIGCVHGDGPLRFAFYLHYWDASLPLRWSGGLIACPPPEPMPVRLKELMPYWPCD